MSDEHADHHLGELIEGQGPTAIGWSEIIDYIECSTIREKKEEGTVRLRLKELVTFHYRGHRFDIDWSKWSGQETIKYDGKIVSDKRVLTSFTSTHEFEVNEDGQPVHYYFTIANMGLSIDGRRNGRLFYSRDKGGLLMQDHQVDERGTSDEPRVIRETVIKEVTLVVCPHCGHRNDSSRRKCERCSASI
ncbi:MAG: zinc finger Ran-binding domain-containing protein [Thermoplasmata archaeon]